MLSILQSDGNEGDGDNGPNNNPETSRGFGNRTRTKSFPKTEGTASDSPQAAVASAVADAPSINKSKKSIKKLKETHIARQLYL